MLIVLAVHFLVLNATQYPVTTSNLPLRNRRCSAFDYSSRSYYFLGTQDSDYQPLQRKGLFFLFQMPYSMLSSPFKECWIGLLVLTRYSNGTIPPNVKLLKDTRGTQHKITTFERMLSVDRILEG